MPCCWFDPGPGDHQRPAARGRPVRGAPGAAPGGPGASRRGHRPRLHQVPDVETQASPGYKRDVKMYM